MKYPYQNTTVRNLKGETWEDVPGFEGYYQASSLGRVRSVDRTIPHPRLGSQFVAGRILSQSVAKNRNIKTGKPMIDLRVSLNVESVPHYYNTRRIIYITFIDKNLDYKKDGLYVVNKNGDGYNNRTSNLKAVTKSEKQNRAIRRKRIDFTYLKSVDRSTWAKNYSRRKPVNQYDLKGKLKAKFASITEASQKTGFDEKGIIGTAKGFYEQWRRFKWKYAKRKSPREKLAKLKIENNKI